MELEKKVACSNWVIYEYFRIGENLDSTKGSDLSGDPFIIQSYFYLIFQGMLFISDRYIVPEYYDWLFSAISHGLEIVDKTIHRLFHASIPLVKATMVTHISMKQGIPSPEKAYEFLDRDLNLDLIEEISGEDYRKLADFISISVQIFFKHGLYLVIF